MLLHPSVIERFVVRRPGRPAWRAGRCAPTCGSWPAGRSRAGPGRTRRCPGSGPRRLIARAEIAGYLALADAQPTGRGGCGPRAWSAGRRCRADPRRPASRPGTRRDRRSGGVVVRSGGPAAGGAGPGPLPPAAAGRGALRRDGLVTGGTTRPQEPDHPADRVAGRGDRPAPAGYQPAAADLAADCAQLLGPGHVHARRRDHLLPAARRPGRHPEPAARPRRSRCSEASGEQPAGRLEEIIDSAGIAARIEALLPIGVRHRQLRGAHPAGRHAAAPGRSPARAPDPGPER